MLRKGAFFCESFIINGEGFKKNSVLRHVLLINLEDYLILRDQILLRLFELLMESIMLDTIKQEYIMVIFRKFLII